MDPSPIPFPPDLVNRAEVARQLGVAPITVAGWNNQGIPYYVCPCGCGKYLYRVAEVREWHRTSIKQQRAS